MARSRSGSFSSSPFQTQSLASWRQAALTVCGRGRVRPARGPRCLSLGQSRRPGLQNREGGGGRQPRFPSARAVSARPQATAAPSRTGLRPRPGVRSAAPDPFPRCPQCRSLRHCPPAELSDPVRQGLRPAALSPSDGSHSAGPSGLPRLLTDWLHVGGSHDALRVESSAGTLTELGETLSLLSQCVTPDTPQRQTVGRGAQDQAWGGGGASTPSRGTCRQPGTPEPVVRGSTALVAPGLGRG